METTPSRILITGGIVIDPANDVEGARDLLVEDGRIRSVTEPGGLDRHAQGARRIDARDLLVLPGLVDMHVHLREPGFEYRETIATGTLAAVAGGFTSVACMANTNPVNDNAAVTEYILERAREVARANVFPVGAVSQGLEGRCLAEIGEMRRAGIVAISDDGRPVADGSLMRRALEYASMFDLPVLAHEEDPSLAQGGVAHEGEWSVRLGLRGIPSAAEESMVARDLALLPLTGGRLHVAHVSTRGTVELVRRAKEKGLPVTAEVTPHHLLLTEEALREYDTNAKMRPPLRSAEDREALVLALEDGTIDAIATDHAPHHPDEKDVEFEQALDGVIGLETALPLVFSLAAERNIPLRTVVRAMTVAPARILGIDRGTLSVGAVADITLFDPEVRWTYSARDGCSKSRNSPFDGWELRGRVRMTLVGGRIVWPLGPTGTIAGS
ncbi:MAG: dihydroorotase [Candidatus Binatia bacterium]|nr:MAG: dihydroorotase [Candidatus Binatia bacterium]